MAAEDVNRLLAGVIILIVGIGILYMLFTSPELDGMAQESAYSMADAINEASYLPVYDGVPDISETDKYVPFLVRFGEPMNVVGAYSIAWAGASNSPTYQIFYEKFPDDKPLNFMTTWMESYPWSGGMWTQLAFYTIIRGVMIGASLHHGLAAFGKKISHVMGTVIASPFIGAYRVGRWVFRIPVHLANALQYDNIVFGTRYASRAMKAIGSTTGESLSDKYLNWFSRSSSRVSRLEALKTLADNGIREAANSQGANKAKARIFYQTIHGADNFNPDEAGKRLRIQPDYSSLETIRKEKIYRSLMDAGTKAEYYKYVVPPPTEIGLKFNNAVAKARGWNVWTTKGWKKAKWPFQKINEFGRSAGLGFRRGVRSAVVGGITETDPVNVKHIQASAVNILEKHSILKDKNGNIIKVAFGELVPVDYNPISVKSIHHFDLLDNMIKYKDIAITFPKDSFAYKHIQLGKCLNDMIDMDNAANPTRHLIKDGTVSFADLKTIDNNMYTGIRDMAISVGLDPDDAPTKIWATAQHNYIVRGSPSLKQASIDVYLEQATELVFDVSGAYKLANPKIATELINVVSGNLEVPAGRAWAGRHLQRAVLFDLGRYKTPVTGGAWMTQHSQERMTDDVETDNSLVFAARGTITDIIPLDENVKNYGVRVYRPEPGKLEIKGPQTALFKGSVVTNPRFYTVSPCFGKGMAWKGTEKSFLGGKRERIFIKMFDDDEYMCSGENCRPGESGCEPEDCINYCYATEERLFGGEDSPSSHFIHSSVIGPAIATYAGCWAVGSLATWGWGSAAAAKYCLLAGAGVGYGIISGQIALHKGDNTCTKNYWTYWQWYTAADTMDQLEIMTTMGISSYLGAVKAAQAAQQAQRVAQQAQRVSRLQRATSYARRAGSRLITDTSMIPVVIGETISSWPNIGWTKYGMNKEYLNKYEAECTWGTPDTETGRKALYDYDYGEEE